jgi:hypothetical protein
MEWTGMEWTGMEWNGMEWNGMEWSDDELNLMTDDRKMESIVGSREEFCCPTAEIWIHVPNDSF